MSFLSRVRSVGNEQIDNTFLIYFRIAFGFILAYGMLKYFQHDLIWTCFQEPRLLFTYRGFDFVKPLPGYGLNVLFLIIATSATCIALGFRYRLAAMVFFFSFTYMFLLDQSWYLNHFYLICLLGFLLPFIPAERAFSIDALRSKEIRSDTTPRWVLWLLRLQIGIPYFYGGLAKLNPDWLTGEPMRTWLAARTHIWVIGQFFQEEWCVYAFSYGGLLYDLFVIPLLLWKRTRIPALIFSVMFHVLNHFMFNIGVFPWLMLAATFVLFPPFDLSRLRFWKTTTRTESESELLTAPELRTVFQLPSFGKWMLYGFLTVQLFLPFRHFLYPGDVAYSREGHCFSWRMKLNTRECDLKLFVHHTDGRVDPVKMYQWVSLAQTKGFRNLDQIQQLALAIRKHYEAIDKQPVQVKGTATVTVNRRKPFDLIRDDIDLSRTPRTILPANWINTRRNSQHMKKNENIKVPAKPAPSSASKSTEVDLENVLARSNQKDNR